MVRECKFSKSTVILQTMKKHLQTYKVTSVSIKNLFTT